MYIFRLISLIYRFVNCSFNDKFREEGIGMVFWVVLVFYYVVVELKGEIGNKVVVF